MALVQKLTGMSRSDEDSTAVGDRRGKSPATRDVASNHGEDQNKTVNNSNGSRNHQLQGRNSNRSCYAGNRRGIFVNNAIFTEDSESSSVITTEENIGEQGQVNSSSCSFAAVPPPYPPPPPPSPAMFDVASSSTSPAINYGAYLSGIPIFATNPSDGFHCVSNESLANFEMDPMFFAPNMRSSFSSSSSSGFDGLTEFRDF
ncbi:PREDICTED: VQ motif-containing protein 20 [Tarenaya hassleriana]|uniref:VQ motif-containing protein 20 n=1 Tax=Tarenaya hassleriana TaxID=28532 RepID=UPI00053C142C|nr:PREDICTED: VQ motif-containing protein 20 [Tarenaya hassleriana]